MSVNDPAILVRRLDVFRQVFQKFDRIMAGSKTRVVINPSPAMNAPAYTDGETITLNAQKLQELMDTRPLPEVVMAAKALNMHELCHVLFTPRIQDEMWRWLRSEMTSRPEPWAPYLKHAWNVLEDQRIETLFVALYKPAAPYFEMNVVNWMLSQKTDNLWSVYLLLYGRRFLPKHMIEQAEAMFVERAGWGVAKQAKSIIDQFLKISYPKGTERAKACTVKMAKLLHELAATNPVLMSNVTWHESATPSESDQDAVREGKVNQKAQGDAQERLKGVKSRKSAAGMADDDEDGTESPADGSEGDEDDIDDAEGADDGDDDAQGGTGASRGADRKPFDVDKMMKDLVDQRDELMQDETFKGDVDRSANAIAEAMQEIELEADAVRRRGHDVPVPHELLMVANDVRVALEALRTKLEETHTTRQMVGRVDPRRFIARQPWDFNFFKLFQPGALEATDIEAVICVDQSGSMSFRAAETATALWVTKYALEALGARVTVLGYADRGYLMYQHDEKAVGTSMRLFNASGGTHPETSLAQAHRVLSASKRSVRITFNLSDGAWQGDVAKCDRYVASMAADGIVTAMVFIGDLNPAYREMFRHNHQLMHVVNDVRAMIPLAVEIVQACVIEEAGIGYDYV